jgi:hypothetical protein
MILGGRVDGLKSKGVLGILLEPTISCADVLLSIRLGCLPAVFFGGSLPIPMLRDSRSLPLKTTAAGRLVRCDSYRNITGKLLQPPKLPTST